MELRPAKKSTFNKKRIGRGNASGQGRTAGKGHKGYKSRSGASGKLHFEGGQMPLMRRLPKRGMKIFSKNHRYKTEYQIVNLDKINNLNLKKINLEILLDKGVIKNLNKNVKILSVGKIDKAVEISAHSFSQTAIEKIEKAGGKVNFL